VLTIQTKTGVHGRKGGGTGKKVAEETSDVRLIKNRRRVTRGWNTSLRGKRKVTRA